MPAAIIHGAFDNDAVWARIGRRRPVVLDMNAWINLVDEKVAFAARAKATLRKAVADGLVFCPLSFGQLLELYKQAEDSRLRVGTLMEELSLNVAFRNREEVFAWEVERGVRRYAGIGPIDLSESGLYVPVAGYTASTFHLEVPEDLGGEAREHLARSVNDRMNSMTLTDLLKMRAANSADKIFDTVRSLPFRDRSAERVRVWQSANGDLEKTRRTEIEWIFELYIKPAIMLLPDAVKVRFMGYIPGAPKDKYGGIIESLLEYLPAIRNYVEIMTAVSQNPTRKDKSNDFFDHEAIPVPLAYGSVFVSRDKGIRDLLENRTKILARARCRYCFELTDLEDWLSSVASL